MANSPSGKRTAPVRKPTANKSESQAVAALFEVAIGQSSVKLELDSKGAVKPAVSAYHRDIAEAAKLAEAEFDRLLVKYCGATEAK